MMTSLFITVLSLTWVVQCESTPSYIIAKLKPQFARLPPSYQWMFYGYAPSPGNALYSYNTLRVDVTTASWKLDNDEDINSQLEKVYESDDVRCPIFKPEVFLSLMRNKKLGIVGDSLSLQQFEGLHNCLTPFATSYNNGTSLIAEFTGDIANSIYYSNYNATIYYCRSNFLLMTVTIRSKCMEMYDATTDFLVLGVGAHFKPSQAPLERRNSTYYNASYAYHRYHIKEFIKKARHHVQTVNPLTRVMWRLTPHVGYMDEQIHLHNLSESLFKHTDGRMWSNVSRGAHWVPVYNEFVKNTAANYKDTVLDWYTLSHQYIEYFAPKNIDVHCDTLHYVADGLPRGGALLIQDALYDYKEQEKQKPNRSTE